MTITKLNNYYLIRIIDNNINIYAKEELEEITKKLIKQIIKKEKLNGLINLEMYYNENYGIIIKLKQVKKYIFDDSIEVKIKVYLDNPFLYKIDYFDMKEILNTKEDIYYYNKEFYINLKNKVSNKTLYKLLELSEVIYEDTYNIIDKGIKINI